MNTRIHGGSPPDHARKVNPGIDAVVRTHSDEERAHLERTGVGRDVVGERELALAIVRYAFGSYGVQDDMAAVAAETLTRNSSRSTHIPLDVLYTVSARTRSLPTGAGADRFRRLHRPHYEEM